MPFADAASVVSGRNSRASNVSRSVRNVAPPDDTMINAGVLSMLKTSTDTGDIGALSFNKARLPTMPRAAHPRKGHVSRPSDSSNGYPGSSSHHHYAPSPASKISDSTSFRRRGSFTSMQSMPAGPNRVPRVPAPAFDKSRDSRSYSLTSAPASKQLPRKPSAASLRSAGHEPRHHARTHPGPPPPMPENRSAYIYPTRLKRPGYRSPSPALSDISSHGLPPQGARRGPDSTGRPLPQTHNSDYGAAYGHDPRYVQSRPHWNRNPYLTPYDAGQYGYRQAPTRPSFGPGVPPMPPIPPQHQTMQYGPPRPVYAGPHHIQRSGYTPYPPMQHAGYQHSGHRGTPSSAGPMAHSMFHNAARMARTLPQRSDTPMTDMGPPSSDPPSSGTMPSSSSPPTPNDSSNAVDPRFIDPALPDLPDSSSEPVLPHRYFEFAEGLHKPIDDPEVDVHHPSVPATGFVQRVRAMLESKATVEREVERVPAVAGQQQDNLAEDFVNLARSELHELAANQTPRITIIEEFRVPSELSASPIRLPELASSISPPKTQQRITREMVKAELAPSSTDDTTQTESAGNTSLETEPGDDMPDDQHEHHRKASCQRVETLEQKTVHQIEATGDKQRKSSSAESATTLSTESTGLIAISGIDYALRFSRPVDTTLAPEDETQSKSPFMLDADTITLQRQSSQEHVSVPDLKHVFDVHQSAENPTESEAPVSPLQLEEGNIRTSAVSPLHTQTAGIDETLHHAVETQDFSDLESSLLASSPPAPAPPTPRTPRAHSKSVQLPPPSGTATDTPTSHPFSLPPDFSNVGDTTVQSTTEMVTDLAVRFSLPTTTITISKPHIVTIAPSSSPEKQGLPALSTSVHALDPRAARRSSVTFADQVVAPLNIKKIDPRHASQSAKEPTVVRARSILRRPSPLEDIPESSKISRDNTTDLTHPVDTAVTTSRFGSTHLPGLKEESAEDMVINDRQHPTKPDGSLQFPLPARIAAVKAMQERRLEEAAQKAKAHRAARHHSRPLAEARDLPSLNFSTIDLIEKLNLALESSTRPARSMEIARRQDFSGIFCPSPQRPQSTEPLRERYTSFFSKPEDFGGLEELYDSEQEESSVTDAAVPDIEVQESTNVADVEPVDASSVYRPLSPEELLNVAHQVNRLSIPSVSGLSDRLSELLPCLKHLHLDHILSTDADVAHTIDDIHQLGHIPRPNTVLSCRTSAGFRTLAERADEIVRHGTHDSVVPVSTTLSINKQLPPLPDSASADKVHTANPTDSKQSHLPVSVSAPSDLGHLVRPQSALVRQKSPATEEEVRQLLAPEPNPIARGAKRSLMLSGASTRPWNQDENYPWGGSNVAIDLSLPSEAQTRDCITSELVRGRRGSRSVDYTSSNDITDTTKGIDIGSIFTLDRSTSVTTERATGVPAHTRQQSKRSIIGSISKKIGLISLATAVIDDITARGPSPPKSSKPDRGSATQSHRAGDRYPTSGLAPPTGFNLDEVRSFFSDDSSERQRKSSLKKRLTAFKSKGKHVRLDPSARSQSVDAAGDTTYDAGSLAAERLGAMSSAHTYDAGMGKAEFHVKCFGEKIRHLMAKGGELLRSWSKRSRAPKSQAVRDDWLSDSLYSGV